VKSNINSFEVPYESLQASKPLFFLNVKFSWQTTYKPIWRDWWHVENVKSKWLWLPFILMGKIAVFQTIG